MRKEGGYRHQGDPIQNGFLPDTSKPHVSVYCAHFSDKTGNISSLGGVCTTPLLDSTELSAYNTSFYHPPALGD